MAKRTGDEKVDNILKEINFIANSKGTDHFVRGRLQDLHRAVVELHAENERLRADIPAWQPIETAPKPKENDNSWIIGYTSWGQHVGKFHEWVGPCEWFFDHYEFRNAEDFDVFSLPTHWQPWPAPRGPLPAPPTDGKRETVPGGGKELAGD